MIDQTPTAELRDLIDQLTRPHTVRVDEYGRTLGHRHQQALLTKLSNARTANIGPGNAARAMHERSTLNIAASELFTSVQKRIRGWAIDLDVPRHWQLMGGQPVNWADPIQLLRAWHTRTLGRTDFDPRPYNATLRGWIQAVTDLVIDPPRRWTLDAACPLCNQRWTLDADGHQVDTLAITERDPAETTTTTCRNCEAVWHGISGARELRIAIDDHQQQVAS